MTTEYILIHEDGILQNYTAGTIDDLQDAVNGLLTSVPVMTDEYIDPDSSVFANDEGLLMGMARNKVAEQVTGYPLLVGPILIGGKVNANGDTEHVTEDTIVGIVRAQGDMIIKEHEAA